jgi:hypothetical protein
MPPDPTRTMPLNMRPYSILSFNFALNILPDEWRDIRTIEIERRHIARYTLNGGERC